MRPTIRLLLLLLVGTLAPWFFPTPRDYLAKVYQKSGVQVVLDQARYEAAPATVAVIRTARSRYQEVTKDLSSGSGVTVKVVDTQVVETSGGSTSSTPALSDLSLNTGCTLSADEVEAVLTQYNSPAVGTGLGQYSVQECERTGIDNAYWMAMFIHESGAGSAGAWAGNKGGGNYTGNTGNIVCAGYGSCYGRFRDYNNDWKLGTTQHFQLLACYRDGGGEGCDGLWNGKSHATIEDAVNTWAPPIENDTQTYAQFVVSMTQEWRQAKANLAQEATEPAPEPAPSQSEPSVTPSEGGRAELWPGATPCAGTGWHAGAFDWCAPLGTPVHTPVSGTFVSQGAYYDEMKYGAYVIILTDSGLEVYLGHLNHETVNPLGFQPGQRVEAGQQVGDLSEFYYSVPHSHVQLRRGGALVGADAWWAEWDGR